MVVPPNRRTSSPRRSAGRATESWIWSRWGERGASTSRGADRVVAIGRYRALLRDLVGETGGREPGGSQSSSAVALVAVLLVAIGRWERGGAPTRRCGGWRRCSWRSGHSTTRRSRRSVPVRFQCLGYRRGKNPVALEGASTRTAASSRRSTAARRAKIWSLREDPTSSTLRRDRDEVDRLLVRMGVPERLIATCTRGLAN